MTANLPTPEQVAESLRSIRAEEDRVIESMFRDMPDEELIKHVGNFALCGRDGIPLVGANPSPLDLLGPLLSGEAPKSLFGTGEDPTSIRWAMAFKELARRISMISNDDDTFRFTIDNCPLRPEAIDTDEFRGEVRAVLESDETTR